jgi:DNA repair protein RecO (recombination protein O)
MLAKTRGIVFRFTKYGDSSIIVTIFTEVYGLQTYIVNGVRSKSSKNKIALYQPLTLLELVVYYKENQNIKRIKEIKCIHPYQSITSDIFKSSIAIFLNEVLNKTVKEESHAQDLFDFIFQSFIIFDHQESKVENFHLIMLVKLSRYLGFGAHTVDEILGHRMVSTDKEQLLRELLHADYQTPLAINTMQRRALLELLLQFYADHVDSFGEMKSVQVLREVMN